jgi:pimeloyl-ACP methyl ester carboxylesterase
MRSRGGNEAHELLAGGRRLEHVWHGPGPDKAPTLVFLHEGLGSVSLWRDFPLRLAEATGCGALVYSRAGYGRSDPAPLPWSPAFMHAEAAVLGEVLDRTSVRDAVLVGHSDGGSIAIIHAGSETAGRVRALILLAPHVFVEEMGLRSIASAAEAFENGDLRRRLERHHGANVDCAFWGWNRVWLDPAFRSWNIEEFLPRIKRPVLVIQGEDDPYGTLRQMDAIAEGCAGPVERLVLPECAHAPHREQAERTLEAAAAFLHARGLAQAARPTGP